MSPNPSHENELFRMAVVELRAAVSAIRSLETRVPQISERLASQERELEIMNRTVNGLSRIVRDGNGQPSLLSRLAALEQSISGRGHEVRLWVALITGTFALLIALIGRIG